MGRCVYCRARSPSPVSFVAARFPQRSPSGTDRQICCPPSVRPLASDEPLHGLNVRRPTACVLAVADDALVLLTASCILPFGAKRRRTYPLLRHCPPLRGSTRYAGCVF